MACGKHTVSTDSCVLHRLRRIRNTYRITGLICSRQSGGCGCAFVFWGTQKPSQRGRCRRSRRKRDCGGKSGEGNKPRRRKIMRFFLFRQHKCCHLPHGGRSCQAYLKGSTITTAVGWMRKSCCLSEHRTPRALPTAMLKPHLRGAARRAHGSSAEHAMRDLIASHAPLRGGRHKVRPVSTKTLTPGDSRGRSPLARLSPLSFVVQRKMESPKGVG